MYRPEGMKENPYPDEVPAPEITDIPATRTMMHRAYEAGADAMLEGLIRDCKVSLNKAMEIWYMEDGDMKGTLVFIPEE